MVVVVIFWCILAYKMLLCAGGKGQGASLWTPGSPAGCEWLPAFSTKLSFCPAVPVDVSALPRRTEASPQGAAGLLSTSVALVL